jgi:UDP-glucose 4-epimerase
VSPNPESLVFGGGGLLGTAVLGELRRRGRRAEAARVPWADHDAARTIGDAVATAVAAGVTRLWWCAGSGVTATTPEALEREASLLEAFAAAVELAASGPSVPSVFFASSAGGVYGGSADPPFTEQSEPRPLGAYGTAKLSAEALLSGLAARGVPVAIARIANLYGPGQDLAKPQGMISRLFVAQETGQPLNVYVPLDTMRDYIYAEDAARICVDFVDRVASRPPAAVVKIVATGRSVTVGALISEVNRICRRRPPLVLAASPFARQQGRDLRLRSRVWTDLDRVANRPLGAGMGAVRQEIRRQLQAGRLPR